MTGNNKIERQDMKTGEDIMPRRKKTELEKVIKNLDDWNKRTKKYLDKMYKKKGNPGDDTLRILEGLSRQNEALAVISTRVEALPKIKDNTTYILATLGILTAVIIGLGTWIVTHV